MKIFLLLDVAHQPVTVCFPRTSHIFPRHCHYPRISFS